MLATPVCWPDAPEAAGDVRGHLLSEAIRVVPGGWSLANVPDLPPMIGLRQLADAYVVVQNDEDCGERGSSRRASAGEACRAPQARDAASVRTMPSSSSARPATRSRRLSGASRIASPRCLMTSLSR